MNTGADPGRPLADRQRPRRVNDYAGQDHLFAPGRPLRMALDTGQPHSMVLWGPPGTGKTTLAHLIAETCEAQFTALSAVLAGVKEVRAAIAQAQTDRAERGRRTVLFIDEVHRFNKAQQDAFLPYIEDGTVVFIGATTENPSFELNNALLSRVRVYVLKSLDAAAIVGILERALTDPGLGQTAIDREDLQRIAGAADGDARRALSQLELACELMQAQGLDSAAAVDEVIAGGLRRFDKGGDIFYDQISALHKAVRGSDPDAALYWLMRMLDGGCDPVYVARRVTRMASEDIGNADPRALRLALDAWEAYDRLGSPEGDLMLSQAVLYLACAPKSNAVYVAHKAARAEASAGASLEVPVHLRNAPTRLARSQGHGEQYRYSHDEPGAFSPGQRYFPEGMQARQYYQPVERGLEIRIAEKLRQLRELDRKARASR